MKNEKSSKLRKILRNAPLVILLLISTKYVFDKDPFNNHKGWFVMIVFYMYMGLFDLIISIRNRNTVSMFWNSIFVAAGLGILFLYMTE